MASEAGAETVVPRERLAALCAGHFPDDPIVPGAYVAGMLAEVSALAVGRAGSGAALAEVERCTFLLPLRPTGDAVLLAAAPETGPDGTSVAAELRLDGRCVARGRFRFT
jgi:3-hydroxymyristoyl/3-hydroxydecanoyl-(acyl carrier protein) dehydratase